MPCSVVRSVLGLTHLHYAEDAFMPDSCSPHLRSPHSPQDWALVTQWETGQPLAPLLATRHLPLSHSLKSRLLSRETDPTPASQGPLEVWLRSLCKYLL